MKNSCEITRICKRKKWIYKGKCPWRNTKSKHGVAKRNQRLRYGLTAFFILEIMSGIIWAKPEIQMNFHIMRKDKGYQVEWGMPSWTEKGESAAVARIPVWRLRRYSAACLWQFSFYRPYPPARLLRSLLWSCMSRDINADHIQNT